MDSYRHHQGVKLSTGGNNKGILDADDEDSIEMEWLGLCPSQVETMGLPSEVFQELSSNDIKRLESLLKPKPASFEPFVERGRNKAERLSELKSMRKYKVELEALHWKGPDYLSRYVFETVMKYESERKSREQKASQYSHRRVRFDFEEENECESI